jgi:hypothetical protein
VCCAGSTPAARIGHSIGHSLIAPPLSLCLMHALIQLILLHYDLGDDAVSSKSFAVLCSACFDSTSRQILLYSYYWMWRECSNNPSYWFRDVKPRLTHRGLATNVGDPDPHVFGPPGSGSISQKYGSGSLPLVVKVLNVLK